nr:hypothetical protein [Clostridiales bacterium]
MDKSDLRERIKDIKGDMSAEEIEKTIEILTLMKTDVRRYDNTAKARKTRLLATTQKRDAKVSFIGLNRQKGFLNLMGASLLTYRDYLPL